MAVEMFQSFRPQCLLDCLEGSRSRSPRYGGRRLGDHVREHFSALNEILRRASLRTGLLVLACWDRSRAFEVPYTTRRVPTQVHSTSIHYLGDSRSVSCWHSELFSMYYTVRCRLRMTVRPWCIISKLLVFHVPHNK